MGGCSKGGTGYRCEILEDIRVAEVIKQDVTFENGKVSSFRVRLNISFKYHSET